MLKPISVGLFVLGVFFVVSTMDYQDKKLDRKHYCQMVEEGIWPPYKGECKDE